MNKEKFIKDFKGRLLKNHLTTLENASKLELYKALSETVMDYIKESWIETVDENKTEKNAYYLSAEFLIGRSLGNNILNFGITHDIQDALKEMNLDLNVLEQQEEDAALGNGGLGRLAACFMESAATLNLPLNGYGVRYREGLFKQYFENGFQMEMGDDWTKHGDCWSIRKESESKIVHFKDQSVLAIPYDMPIIGYHLNRINRLRLWQCEAINDFDFNKFNNFQYMESLKEKNEAEDVTRVLYPNDIQTAGKILRLKQQYFFCSASMQDLVDKYIEKYPEDKNFENFTKFHILQLNDTHPVMAIPELMRILLDRMNLTWENAWKVVSHSFAFTNHTILQEALERWRLDIVEIVSPRCLEIIKEMDRRFINSLNTLYYSVDHIEHLKIIAHGEVRMAHIALYTAIHVNGVAKLHTEILKTDTLKNWYLLYPEKFVNKTNGITPRRWLLYANPELSNFITDLLKTDEWILDMTKLKELEKFIDQEDVLDRLNEIKDHNKRRLAKYIQDEEGISIQTNTIFDIQVKRLHEYKRQLLNALHILHLYYRIKEHKDQDFTPRTFIFGAKAAPGYFRAKAIIKFINEIARMVNSDPEVNDKLKVVFVQNFRVTYGEYIYPACDVSEQISTAGKEASGTGNMKFMFNGAVTLGTWDGANIEIFEAAGIENNYNFGATVEQLDEIQEHYNPKEYYSTNKDIKRVVDTLLSDQISDNGSFMFLDIYNSLVNPQNGECGDQYYSLKDFEAYKDAQEKIEKDFKNRRSWAQKCLMNIANCGRFSSDRTIAEYAKEIWNI